MNKVDCENKVVNKRRVWGNQSDCECEYRGCKSFAQNSIGFDSDILKNAMIWQKRGACLRTFA